MSADDQRRHPRCKPPKTVVVAWQAGMQRDVSRVDSLALGGLFLRTKKPVAIRSMVQILLDMPIGQVRGRGIVRRHQAERDCLRYPPAAEKNRKRKRLLQARAQPSVVILA